MSDGSLTRREFLAGSAGMLSVTALSCAGRERHGRRAGKPNILFLYLDQLRAQALGFNGETNVTTPNIDRLAKQGVVFSNSLSTCPVCTPYRGMLLTGRYPTHTGIVANFVNMHPREYSIAEAFAEEGYRTGYIGKWHLTSSYHTESGRYKASLPEEEQKRNLQRRKKWRKQNPESEFVPPGPARQGFEFWAAYNFHANFNHAHYYRDTDERLIMPKHETDSETDIAIEFMKEQKNSSEPFFLVVAPHPPHPPWREAQCPPGYLEKVKPELDWRPNVKGLDSASSRDPRAYYAMVKNIDDNVGRLMSFLEESGMAENTIFVLTSDHGEMMWSHGRTNKMVPYAEAVDVPLIMRWPGRIPAGIKTDTLYTPMDHMPTMLSLAGMKVPESVDGADLSAEARGKKAPERDAVLMMNYTSHWDFFESGTNWPEWRGVRTKTHTYVRWFGGEEELYNNAADPYQMKDLSKDERYRDRLENMRSKLVDLLAEAHDDFLPGTAYGEWYDDHRNLLRTALGEVE
ncbi:sulfatase [Candidatus Hydrogenedentota bacterium]